MANERKKESTERHEAYKIIAEGDLERFKSRNASLGERLLALSVAGAMRAKVKFGMGLKKPIYSRTIRCLNGMEK